MELLEFLAEPFGADVGEAHWALAWALVPLRLVLGFVFADAGYGKFRRGISGTGDWFAGLGIPLPQASARLVAATEMVGGTLLLVGLLAHWVAVALAVDMAVAAWVSKFRLGAPFRGGEVQGYELNLLMLAGSLAFAIGGAGPLALDRLLA